MLINPRRYVYEGNIMRFRPTTGVITSSIFLIYKFLRFPVKPNSNVQRFK